MLTQQEIKKRLYYNPETGIFIKLLSTNHVKAGFKLPIENVEIVAKFAELITEPLEAEIAKLKNENNFVETLYVLDDCECAGELETWEDSCDEGEIIDLMGYKVSESFNASFIKINGKLIPNEVKAQEAISSKPKDR